MRSKYGSYPEYHTSLDNLDLITENGLEGSFEILKECLILLENNKKYKIKTLGEPHFSKHNLFSVNNFRAMLNFVAYADGTKDLIEISEIINIPVWELYQIIKKLKEAKLIEELSI